MSDLSQFELFTWTWRGLYSRPSINVNMTFHKPCMNLTWTLQSTKHKCKYDIPQAMRDFIYDGNCNDCRICHRLQDNRMRSVHDFTWLSVIVKMNEIRQSPFFRLQIINLYQLFSFQFLFAIRKQTIDVILCPVSKISVKWEEYSFCSVAARCFA